jgi:hypothetical protein
MLQTKVVEKMKTRFVFSNFFPPASRVVYEIIWKNMVEPDKPHGNIIRRMRFAYGVSKATNTFGICNTYCFLLRQLFRERISMLHLYVHCLSCIYLNCVKTLNLQST